MSSMEEKKQLSGIKVSAIANKFQLNYITDNYDNKSGFDIEMNDANKTLSHTHTHTQIYKETQTAVIQLPTQMAQQAYGKKLRWVG
ncbi:hypothetical protein TSAR_009471 [Trichomalopsis sarcophagae]|uniref:Uncharacterized protein n=1 Tax=Trichomalopsis sarcophagae TaxID=543379 RepID=A0A232FGY6_9HYME|nr:hypothetical protein TSAR_009471 [Trichomalopsis sarcophagae]